MRRWKLQVGLIVGIISVLVEVSLLWRLDTSHCSITDFKFVPSLSCFKVESFYLILFL